MKKLICFLLCAVLIASLFGCALFQKANPEVEPEQPVVAEPEPEPEPVVLYLNPLTGVESLEQPYNGRPFAVSVNNIDVALPQSGVSVCDIMVEIETEGGISRLMCLFADPAVAKNGIGSIRSLRHQFVSAVWPWNPVIVHIGTSDYCESYLYSRGIYTMNGFYNDDFIYVDQERAKEYDSEHTKYTDATHLNEAMQSGVFSLDSAWNPVSPTAFNFADAAAPTVPSSGSALQVTADFSRFYDATFIYDPATGKYEKYQHGSRIVDAGNSNAPVAFDNVLLIFADTYGLAGDLVDVDYSSGGKGVYLVDGKYEQISWIKDSYDQAFVFYREDGSELRINPGTTYLGVIRSSFFYTLELS